MGMIEKRYRLWLENVPEGSDIAEELEGMSGDSVLMEDCFYRELSFGTGGLRGVIGAGTNRMNIYTVAKASQGLADYVRSEFDKAGWSVAVSYDSRIKSGLFAQTAAGVFAANGIRVHIYRQLMPTPCLSYAVRELGCAAGIMVTASHNPAKYNGYKVYGADGCQITTEAADVIQEKINGVDIFTDVMRMSFDEGIDSGMISYISDDVEASFIECVKGESVLAPEIEMDRNVSIVYSPLNGTGLKPVMRTLRESGFTNITVVKEQELPDGNFPTCPYPNPEIVEAMALGMEYAKRCDADLLLATDPDCDRCGIAVKKADGEFTLLTGNETGILLLDYICARRREYGTMPEDAVVIKTIVTTDMADRIAESYGVGTINVLTGFKFIGEQIGLLDRAGKAGSYIFGFEESYGYLSGAYVRDKDAVDAVFMICEMFAYYRTRGVSLVDRLQELYAKFGYTLNTLHSYTFEGASGALRMEEIMKSLHEGVDGFGSLKVLSYIDYSEGVDGLPKSDVLKYVLEGDCVVVIRPSGTEPKVKAYITVCAEDEKEARKMEKELVEYIGTIIQ